MVVISFSPIELERKDIQDIILWLNQNPSKHERVVTIGVLLERYNILDAINSYLTTDQYSSLAVQISTLNLELSKKEEEYRQKESQLFQDFAQKLDAQKSLYTNADIIQDIKKELELSITSQLLKSHQEEITNLKVAVNVFQNRYLEARQQIEDITSQQKDIELQKLNQIIQDQQKQIDVLQRTNFAKGNLGEQTIINSLKCHYTDFTFHDSSGTPHSCDIHMIDQNNKIIAIESKYKTTITKNDIEKFYDDIKSLKQNNQLQSAIFVSVTTKNIPNKGDICFEITDGIPTLFLGFEDASECNTWLKHYVKLILKISQQLHNHQHLTSQQETIIQQLHPIIISIKSLKANVEKLRKHLTPALIEIEQNIECIINSLTIIVDPTTSIIVHKCEHCDKEFPSQRSLAIHKGRCKNKQQIK